MSRADSNFEMKWHSSSKLNLLSSYKLNSLYGCVQVYVLFYWKNGVLIVLYSIDTLVQVAPWTGSNGPNSGVSSTKYKCILLCLNLNW